MAATVPALDPRPIQCDASPGRWRVRPRDLGAATSPEQCAIVLFEQGRQTLLLQSALNRSGEGREDTVGWVLPVPAVPDLATMDTSVADSLFWASLR